MARSSEHEIIAAIEEEVLSHCGVNERQQCLMVHCAELADRWIGLANLETVSSTARVQNDSFEALRICLTMVRRAIQSNETSDQFKIWDALIKNMDQLRRDPEQESIKSFVKTLQEVFGLSI